MAFLLPPLPFSPTALVPHLSQKTFEYHYGQHHQIYLQNLNNLLDPQDDRSIEAIIDQASRDSAIFNNAAQVWNHAFYWNSLCAKGGHPQKGPLLTELEKSFGSYAHFCDEFKKKALGQFGSGWAWVIWDGQDIAITTTPNAHIPGVRPLLVCDVWEHAYYMDYHHKRGDYVDVFLHHLANWDFAEHNMRRAWVF